MIISISGTPGTGKSEVAKSLAKKLDANLISIKSLIRKEGVPYIIDKERRSKIINIKILQKYINNKIRKLRSNFYYRKKPVVIEGHLSHFLKSDMIFILRCNPLILMRRLKKRGWNEKKINENVMAEMLDAILIEAYNNNNITERSPRRTFSSSGYQKPSVFEYEDKLYKKIYQIDTTRLDARQTADKIVKLIKNPKSCKKLKIDWLQKYPELIIRLEK